MPLIENDSNGDPAEGLYRDAFERLKSGRPTRLPNGTPVSQNNVAKEAGRDPSGLRKTRYPTLIAEIQTWVHQHRTEDVASSCKTHPKPQTNDTMQGKIENIKAERDHALSLLVEADAKILEMNAEIKRLRAILGDKVTALRSCK